MTIVTSTTACNTNLSNTISFENSCSHRDASFSSYLNGDEGMLSLKLVDSDQNISSPLSSSHDHIYTGKKKVEDTEIGVFSAEKYFKGAMDEDGNPKSSEHGSRKYHQPRKDIQMHIDFVKPKAQPRTPSNSSVSSWNSQSQLLPRNQQHKKTSKVQNKSFLSSLGCGCSCSDKNSVDINDHVSGNSGVTQNKAIIEQPTKAGDFVQTNKSVSKTWTEGTHRKKVNDMGGKLNKEDCFSFPVLNSKQENLTVKVKPPGIGDDVTRKSLEVFGSPILENKNKSSSFERKLIMLPRDVVPLTAEETEILGSPNLMYNDTDSDASSDLFEIESFSTKSNSLLATQKSEGISGCVTPTPCYAPSDASITWSVVTASAADFSIVSDSEELRTTANTRNFNKIIGNAKSTPGKELNKRSANVFLGCKSQKAVRVVGDAHKRSEKAVPGPQGRCRLDPCKPVATFQAETKLAGFGSTQVHKAFNTRSVSPAHASHLLYIQ